MEMEYSMPSENAALLSVGQLSERYSISSRTLRLYHEMGLLVPQHVDVRTGYRYYSTAQLPRLEMILQMKSVGLSLKRIQNILETRDLSVFEALLSEQIDELDEKILQYTASRKALTRQLNSCKQLRNPPTLDKVFIEFIAKRRAMLFDIDEYDFRKSYDVSPWKLALEQIRTTMIERNISLALFSQVGCMISADALKKDQFLCSKGCILLDSEGAVKPGTTLQSGIYACMYRQYVSMDSVSESIGLQQLIDYIRENQYQIVGPYLGEVVAEDSVFDYNNHNILVKLQVPITLSGGK